MAKKKPEEYQGFLKEMKKKGKPSPADGPYDLSPAGTTMPSDKNGKGGCQLDALEVIKKEFPKIKNAMELVGAKFQFVCHKTGTLTAGTIKKVRVDKKGYIHLEMSENKPSIEHILRVKDAWQWRVDEMVLSSCGTLLIKS